MISFYNIKTTAAFESKLLFRSWFLRIFIVLALIVLGFITYFMVATKSDMEWSIAALPSYVPYVALMFFNLVQAVISVFLASDFARRDKSNDTSKVIYVRSVSNSEYYIGKVLGLLYVFLITNIIILSEAFIMNLISKTHSIDFFAYAIYPFLISLPTLVFLAGLSYILMTVTRNQAITFILLIAYIAITSFYLGDKLNYMLDFMAYRVPLAKSDFIGFGNFNEIVIHRGMYVLYGIGLIFLSICFMKRLPQSNSNLVPALLAVIFIGGGGFFSYKYLHEINTETVLRERSILLNNQKTNNPIVDITDYNINLNHNENNIDVDCDIQFTNSNEVALTELIFSLNRSLKIEKITLNDNEIPFTRNEHLLLLSPTSPIKKGEKGKLDIKYTGNPDQRTCYLDTDTSSWGNQMSVFLVNFGNCYGMVSPDYVILTKEINWYPVAGTGFSSTNRFKQNKDFANYTLEVSTESKLMAISQGLPDSINEKTTVFKTESPLPQISLIIGEYEKLSVEFDSIEYALYKKKEHKYFTQHLTKIGDTIGYVIQELKDDYERKLGLEYPFKRFSLVEVPVQFRAQPRLTTVAWEYSQPEMILLPENGNLLEYADFRRWETERKRRNNQKDLSETEQQISMFKRAVNYTLAPSTTSINLNNSSGEINNYFSLFPLFYTHVVHISSSRYDILNQTIESYLSNRVRGQLEDWVSQNQGITPYEKANLYLQKQSLKYYLKNELNRDNLVNIISLKGDYLFTMIKYQNKEYNFDNILKEIIKENTFKNIPFNDFMGQLNKNSDWKPLPAINNWYTNNSLPGYAISGGGHYKIRKDDKEKYQVWFSLTNYGKADGYILVAFEHDNDNNDRYRGLRGFGTNAENTYTYNIKAGETKEISLLLEDKPNSYTINTITSLNTPNQIKKYTDNWVENKNALPKEGVKLLDKPVLFNEPNEVVVDNIDSGFVLTQPKSVKPVAKLFEPDAKNEFNYNNFNWWPQSRWQQFPHSDVYGRFIKTAWQIKPGKGNLKAIWNAEIKESGEYDVYTFILESHTNHYDRWGRNRNGKTGTYYYTVYHDDGKEEVELDLKNIVYGWNYLGTYYFSQDTAKVELSDKGESPVIIIADAIKWVKK